MLKRIFRKLGKHWPVTVLALMLLIFLIITSSSKRLTLYREDRDIPTYTVEPQTEEKESIPTSLYTDNETGASFSVPDDWQYVLKDGFTTFIHSPSATSVQMQILPYDPTVNNATYESMQELCASSGFQIVRFDQFSGANYELLYQSQGMSGVTDYIEDVYWDRANIVKLVVTVNDGYYDRMADAITTVLTSFAWTPANPVPDGCRLVYDPVGDFEFAVPVDWVTGSAESAFYAYDEELDAVLTVNLLDDATSIGGISELDYSNFLAEGKSGFALTYYENSGESIYGEATYTSSTGGQRGLMQYYYANGVYHYIVTYEFPTEEGESLAPACLTALQATRIFMAPQEAVTETEEQEGIPQVGDLEFDPSAIPEEFQNNNVQENADSGAPTFADALVQVAGISAEQAQTIVQIWQSVGAGNPIYADVYAQDENGQTIYIEDGQGNAYYLFLTADGNPYGITTGTPDGQAIWAAQ